MDQNQLAQIFNDSYERVIGASGNSREFFLAFYALLMASSAEAASKFRNTDMEKLVRMLHSSIAILLSFYATGNQDDVYLQKLSERHGRRGVDVPSRLYSVWLECLIANVERHDPKFNDDVATAWRSVFSKGIEFMASRSEEG